MSRSMFEKFFIATVIAISAAVYSMLLDVNTLKAERVSDTVLFGILSADIKYIRVKLDKIYESN